MTCVGGKFWEFYVSEFALIDTVADVLAEYYEDGPLPSELPGLIYSGANANAWRYTERDVGSLAYLRARVLSDHLAQILTLLDVFTHDPEVTTTPAVDRAEARRHLATRVRGSNDREPVDGWPVTDPHLAPLMAGVNFDEFSAPVDLDEVVRRVVDVIADAIEQGQIDVDASEPYDSCSGCGGYHNVNDRC